MPRFTLPPIVHGETIRSFVERVALLNGLSMRQAAAVVFGAPWLVPSWELPRGLSRFAESVGSALGYADAAHWLAAHTHAPYYESTLTTDRRQTLASRLLFVSNGPVRPVLPSTLEEWFRKPATLCPDCDEESIQTLGFSHVHREWMLPFSTRCTVHGTPLRLHRQWSVGESGRHEAMGLLPGRKSHGLEFSTANRRTLGAGGEHLEVMGELLQSRGYLTRQGSVRRTALEELVLTYSRGRFEHPELNHLLTTRSRLHDALADLYSKHATLHPAVATVVCAALRQEPEVAQQQLLPSPREMQMKLLRDALMSGLKPSAAAAQAGTCTTTAVQMALTLGLSVQTRPKKLREQVVLQVIRLLGGGRRPGQVAKAVGVSLPTVYRIMARTQGLKHQLDDAARAKRMESAKRRWLALMAVNPQMGVKELRAKQSAVYAWLYRNARDWLKSAGAPAAAAKRVDSTARHRAPVGADQALVDRLIAARDVDAMDMPRQLTRTALAQQCGRSVGTLSKGSKATPLSEAASARLAERDEAYVLRRLSAATAHLHNAGESIATWRVIKASRVRAEFIARSGISAEDAIARTRALAMKALCAA